MRLDRLDITRDSTETTKQAFVNKCMQLLNDIQRALLQTEEDNEGQYVCINEERVDLFD